MAELLIENGADVNIRYASGKTPLLLAIELGNERIVNLLIGNGANFKSVRDDTGKTLLERAREMGKEKIVDLLIKKGADTN